MSSFAASAAALLRRVVASAVVAPIARAPAAMRFAAAPALRAPLFTPAVIAAPASRSFSAVVIPTLFQQHGRQQGREGGARFGSAFRTAMGVLAGVGLGVSVHLVLERQKRVKACGIIAFVGEEDATPYLIEGLNILQNRGYDSAGICTISHTTGALVTSKHASKGSTSDSIALVEAEAKSDKHRGDRIGIAHTRWATHGGKTDQNAHPHSDQRNRIALVHNGTIENSDVIKQELLSKGVKFLSETDTEVIAQLIGWNLDQNLSLMDAVKQTLSRLEGTWGLAIIATTDPQQIIAARNGSPLVVGVTGKKMFVASEVSAFNRHCFDFVPLKDGEVAVVSLHQKLHTLDVSRIEVAPKLDIPLSPAPYPHWTIKEIMDQPEAVLRTLGFGGRFDTSNHVKLGGLEANKQMLLSIRNLVISACGTSLYAGMYGAEIMRALGIFDTVQTFDASELTTNAVPGTAPGLLVVSQSGETKDVHRALELAMKQNVPVFSVVNAIGSLIARTTRCGVYVHAGRENAVASTKAFTTQVTALALIGGWFAHQRSLGFNAFLTDLIDSLHRLPSYVGAVLSTRDQMRDIAVRIRDQTSMFVLGKGFGYPIAMEGALKIKEISYIHAEGYSGGALKHGPFALLDEKVPVVLLMFNDSHAEFMRIAAAQVKARGAHLIIITDKPELAQGLATDVVVVPSNGPLTALLGVIPMQFLAYELSLLRNADPDKPRHLAKAVTVD